MGSRFGSRPERRFAGRDLQPVVRDIRNQLGLSAEKFYAAVRVRVPERVREECSSRALEGAGRYVADVWVLVSIYRLADGKLSPRLQRELQMAICRAIIARFLRAFGSVLAKVWRALEVDYSVVLETFYQGKPIHPDVLNAMVELARKRRIDLPPREELEMALIPGQHLVPKYELTLEVLAASATDVARWLEAALKVVTVKELLAAIGVTLDSVRGWIEGGRRPGAITHARMARFAREKALPPPPRPARTGRPRMREVV